MLEPIIKPNKKIIAYRAWLSEQWKIGVVTPVKFISYKYKHYRQTKPYPFTYNGENFIGEVWECIDKEGNLIECTFKHYIDNAYKSDSSLSPNKSPIMDGFKPILLFDSYDEYLDNMVNRQKHPNLFLRKQNVIHRERINNLKKLLEETSGIKKEIVFYILRHKESPVLATLRAVENARKNHPEIYNEIINTINERKN